MFHSLQTTRHPHTLTLLPAVCPGLEFIIHGAKLPTCALLRTQRKPQGWESEALGPDPAPPRPCFHPC